MEPPSPSTSRASSSFRSQGLGSLGSLCSKNIGRCITCNATTFVSNAIAGTCSTCRHTLEAAAAAARAPMSPSSEDGIDHAYDPASSDDEVEPPVAQPEEAEDKASNDDISSDSTAQSAPSQHNDADGPEENVPQLPPSPPKGMISASPVHTVEARKHFAPKPADEEEAAAAEASDEDAHAAAVHSPRQLFPPVAAAKSSKGFWLLAICAALMLALFGAGVLSGAGEAGMRQVADEFASRLRAVVQWAPGATCGAPESLASRADAATAPLAAKLSAASASTAKTAGKGKPMDEDMAGGTVANVVSAEPEADKARPPPTLLEPVKTTVEPQSPPAAAKATSATLEEVERDPLALASLRVGEVLRGGGNSTAKTAGKGKPMDEGVAGGTVANVVSAEPEANKARPPPTQLEPVKMIVESQSPPAAAKATSATLEEVKRDPLALASLRVGEALRAGGKYVVGATGAVVLFVSEAGVLTLAEGTTPAAAKEAGRVLWSADSRCVVLRRVGGPLQRVFRRGPVEADYSVCTAVTVSLSRDGRVELRRGKKVVWRGQRTVKAGVASRSETTMRLEVSAEGTLELAGIAALKV